MEHWPRAILHVDMDAFFASIEQLDNPELRGRPVIVGGPAESRGVVSTASYEARKFGVHSAMPTAVARRLCPQGVYLRGRYERYNEVSGIIQAVFTRYTPLVMPLSCDEAFLDVTGSQRLFGDPLEIGRKIKEEIRQVTGGLTGSVGIAGTLFVAKIASELEKPDGLTAIRDEEVQARLAVLPVRAIWGVGKAAEARLHKSGIETVGQLQQWAESDLVRNFGDFGRHLFHLSRGIDLREVESEASQEKSISNEHTFSADLTDRARLEHVLLRLCDKVARRAREAELPGKTIQIKLRYSDFSAITRRQTLAAPTACGQEIYLVARELLRKKTEYGVRPVRLIGVGVSGFTQGEEAESQMSLFAPQEERDDPAKAQKIDKIAKAEAATDAILRKHGRGSIGRGSILLNQDPD